MLLLLQQPDFLLFELIISLYQLNCFPEFNLPLYVFNILNNIIYKLFYVSISLIPLAISSTCGSTNCSSGGENGIGAYFDEIIFILDLTDTFL